MRAREAPARIALRGLGAGLLGTATMTATQKIAMRLAGADSDSSEQQPSDGARDPWEDAPAPAQAARQISQAVFTRDVSPGHIPLLTSVLHWSYGTGWGLVYGVVAERAPRSRALRLGALFGAAVWAMSYVQLVPMGIYEPPWQYPAKELTLDLSYHLSYGVGTGLGFALLSRLGD